MRLDFLTDIIKSFFKNQILVEEKWFRSSYLVRKESAGHEQKFN